MSAADDGNASAPEPGSGKDQPGEHLQVARGAGLAGVGTIFEAVLRYLSMLVVTRNYGREAYGVFGFIMMLNEMGQRISSAGLHDGVMRHVAIHSARGETNQVRGAILFAAKIMLGVGILYALGLAFMADVVAESLDKGDAKDVPKDIVASVVRLSCFALPTTALVMVIGRSLRALKQVGWQVLLRSILWPLLRVSLIVVFLFTLGKENLDGLAWAVVLSAGAVCVLGFYVLHRILGLFGPKAPNEIDRKEFLSYALPLVGVDILTFFSLSADIFMLGNMRSQGELGAYVAGARLAPMLGFPLALFLTLLTPLSAELYSSKRMDDLRKLYQTSVRWIFSVSMPITITAILWSTPLLGHLGDGFDEGALAFVILLSVIPLNGFGHPAGYAVTMAGYSRLTLLNSAVMLATVVGIGWWLIPEYGMVGAAIARASASVANCALTLTQGYLILGLNPIHRSLFKPMAASLAAFGVGWLLIYSGVLQVTLLHAVFGGIAVTTVHVVITAALGLTQEDKDVLVAGGRPLVRLLSKLGVKIDR